MHTVRRVPEAIEGTYLSVSDGLLMSATKESSFVLFGNFPDWALYTELGGGAGSSKGLMKMVSEIDIAWVKHKIPLLKESENLDFLNEKPVLTTPETLGKREAE